MTRKNPTAAAAVYARPTLTTKESSEETELRTCCSFRPKTKTHRGVKQPTPQPVVSRLLACGKAQQADKAKLVATSRPSFVPQINSKSRKIMARRALAKSTIQVTAATFESLDQDARGDVPTLETEKLIEPQKRTSDSPKRTEVGSERDTAE